MSGGLDLARLRRDLAKERMSDLVRRHARLDRRGKPVKCVPNAAERDGIVSDRQAQGSDFKVIFDSREAAEAFCAEVHAAGLERMRAYPCGRSRHGHHHVSRRSA